jgi:L-ascorbate metabolism protein UlaG (beta-lactamase superfamily)
MTTPWESQAEQGQPTLQGSLMFIGTATVLLRMGPFVVLTDPNFLHRGQRAYLGRGMWSRRLTDPAMEAAALPRLDAVLLSHLHGDHFDRVARRRIPRDVPVITTPHAAQRLGRIGFSTLGLNTWQRHQLVHGPETLSFEALPAVHARGVMARLLPPVMGTLIEHRMAGGPSRRIYLTGDTITGPHLDEIARRHPNVDLAVVHLGGTRILGQTVTMNAVQGLDFLRRVQPKQVLPVHYDDYPVFRSPLEQFEQAARAAGFNDRLRVVQRGRTVPIAWP